MTHKDLQKIIKPGDICDIVYNTVDVTETKSIYGLKFAGFESCSWHGTDSDCRYCKGYMKFLTSTGGEYTRCLRYNEMTPVRVRTSPLPEDLFEI